MARQTSDRPGPLVDGLAHSLLCGILDAIESDPVLASRLRSLLGARLQPPAADDLIKLREAGVSVRTLRAAIAAGDLQATRIGRDLMVRRSDLQEWLQARRVPPRGDRPVPRQTAAQRAIAEARQSGRLRAL